MGDGISKVALYQAHLEKGNHFHFRALGGSMSPAIRSGDLVFISPEKNYKPGDIILVARENNWFLHRLLRIEKDQSGFQYLITKGDALKEEDQPFAADAFLGVAYAIERNGRHYPFSQLKFRLFKELALNTSLLEKAHKLQRFVIRLRIAPVKVWAKLNLIANRHLPLPAANRFTLEQVICRTLDIHDISQILKLYQLPRTESNTKKYKDLLKKTSTFGVGLFLHDQLVAAVWNSPMWEMIGIPGYWGGAAVVKKPLRGRGLGRMLAKNRLQEAAKRGIKVVYSNTKVNNYPALATLKAAGFVRVDNTEWQEKLTAHLGSEQVIMRAETGFRDS